MNAQESNDFNWVELRANCTLQGTFEEIASVIEKDVKRFNRLSAEKRRDLEFTFKRKALSLVTVFETHSSDENGVGTKYINIVKNDTGILVYLEDRTVSFEVKQEWNPEQLTCDLKIGGEVHSLSQISQRAIGDLMFDN